jgi:hypothetical protein
MALIRVVVLTTAFIGIIFVTYFLAIQRSGLGFSGSEFPWPEFIATCVAMFLGIFFGTLYRRLSIAAPTISIIEEVRSVFDTAAFWKAVCVAPLVFLALYAVAKGTPGDLPSLLLAFQNGFFWENILKRSEP